MALLNVNFMSKSLLRTVTFNVYLPVDKTDFFGKTLSHPPYITLYLLHGILGDQNDWLVGTEIEKLAKEFGIAVVMPSGENHFYLDSDIPGYQYSKFIGEELVAITRTMFPLSTKREDTIIAGLSMGGYGALYNGLKYTDTFGYIGAFSTALVLDEAVRSVENTPIPFQDRRYYEAIFGNLDDLLQSDKNPEVLIEKLINKKTTIPQIMMTCGTEDPVLPNNQKLNKFMIQKGIKCNFSEFSGGHEWPFWNQSIKKFMDWLPLKSSNEGINSGNVGLSKESE